MQFGINLLLPPRCPICDKPVRLAEGHICHDCYNKLEIIQEPACFRCGKPLAKEQQEYCRDCSKREHAFICGRALYSYESVQTSIYRFKYTGRQEYAIFFGREMADQLSGFITQLNADALVPVPISRARFRKRGYNQAETLATELGKQLHIPIFTHLVERIKDTLPQKGLNAVERQKNLKKAFKIVQNDVKLDTIIIIDDIYTTGSTMDALAKVLLSSGVKRIYFITLAITTGA
ncbi:MAG TPA: ComF family protein [Lachnospiraceae bacterium]|nr:ComF family protein [Lachnospiraceae bacterium]